MPCLSRLATMGRPICSSAPWRTFAAFYMAVAEAIGRGELDAQILKLPTERSATLTKKGSELAKAA